MNKQKAQAVFACLVILLSLVTVIGVAQTPPGANTLQHGEGGNMPTLTAQYGYFYGDPPVNITEQLFGDFGTLPISTTSDVTAGGYFLDTDNVTDVVKYPVTEASYVVWADNSTGTPVYYAKNGATGAIPYSGTNKTTIIGNVISALTSGGVIHLKEIQMVNTITIPNDVIIIEDYQGSKMLYYGEKRWSPSLPLEKPVFQNRVEQYAENYELISDFDTIGDWVLDAGSPLENDTTNYKEGSQGVKWVSTNAVLTKADRTINLDALGKHLTFWCYIDNIDNLGIITFYIQTNGGWAKYFKYDIAPPFTTAIKLTSGWNKIGLSRSMFVASGGAADSDWALVTKIRYAVTSIPGQTVNVTFDDLKLVQNKYPAKITLRFDDGWDSTYTEAREYMDKYGYRGVSVVITDWIDDIAIYMTTDQLDILQERGWDIISHGRTHSYLTTLTSPEFVDELANSQKWLIQNGYIKGSRFFVPPYHDWDSDVMEIIRKYYLGCQTLIGTEGYDNIPSADQHKMICKSIGSSAVTTATVQGWIDNAIITQSWLTIVFHNIANAGSEPRWSPANFQTIIDYINSTGIEVVTFSDVFDDTIETPLKSGFATILNATTSIVITHGLGYTPTTTNTAWSIIPLELSTNDPGQFYIDTFTSTQATIHCRNDPGGSNLDIRWIAQRVS